MMKSSTSSPIKQEERSMREGILAVLRDDQEDHEPSATNKPSPSIRRTLSADMSSKKWLAQNGFSSTPPKDDPSADRRPPSPPSCEESNPSQDDVLRSIVRSQKDNFFVPPSLKKRSLSGRSLETCTESLGSETGSDCNLSSDGDGGDNQEWEKSVTTRDLGWSEKLGIAPVKYKNAPVRPIPPPIRSSLSMSSRREGGRLVVEAVAGPPRSRFVAQRGNGRLVLRMSDEGSTFDGIHEGDGDNNKAMKNIAYLSTNYNTNKKKNMARWMNKVIDDKEGREGRGGGDRYYPQIITQSLPPPPPPITRAPRMIPKPRTANSSVVSLFSSHDHFWRDKAAINDFKVANEGNKYTKPKLLKKYGDDGGATNKEYYSRHQDSKGCKELRRSLLMWGEPPYCIATS